VEGDAKLEQADLTLAAPRSRGLRRGAGRRANSATHRPHRTEHGDIFFSYCRDDSRSATGRLADALHVVFGPDPMFREMDSIALGQQLEAALERHRCGERDAGGGQGPDRPRSATLGAT
jgi:hypothetical protein